MKNTVGVNVTMTGMDVDVLDRLMARAAAQHQARQMTHALLTGFPPGEQRVTVVQPKQLEPPTIDAEYEVK